MLSAFHEVVTGRAPDTLRAYLLAVLVQMLVVNALIEFGNIQVSYLRFFGLATALGGFVLGLGMVLSVGCAGAVFYRAGEGRLDYIIVTIAYAVSAWASNNWLVDPIRHILGGEGISLALPRALGIDRWLVVVMICLAALLWLIRGRRLKPSDGWDWMRTGLAIGIVGIVAWITSALTGNPSGLGTVQGSNNLAALFLQGDLSALNWNLFVVATIPIGSFIASRQHGKSSTKPFRSERIPKAIAGGTLMGLGATLAGGDNVLHGLSGVPILAVSSIVVMVCIFAGVWIGIRLGWLKS
jgi:uncharacterized membrane protein YedE/YeeE